MREENADMRTWPASELQAICTQIFDAAGSPHEESAWVTETLVRSNLVGHDSHGIVRMGFYIGRIEKGELKPGAPFEIERETRAMAVVNGHQGWGQVIARRAMRIAIDKAGDSSVGIVALRDCQHIGRVGEWLSMAAAENMIGLAFVNSRGGPGHVAPWGGIDRRLKPNVIGFSAPSGMEWPVLVDLSASVVAGGKIEVALFEGKQLPEGCLIDVQGNPTTDPKVFYGPQGGAMLPLGGIAGHKGYALNIMADLMAGALTGSGCSGQKDTLSGNGVVFQVINIADFVPVSEFVSTVQELVAWVKSSRRQAGVSEILFPGEVEYRTAQRRLREGFPVPQSLWQEIVEIGDCLGVAVPS
jgi:uncharacterized oxidoreductase